MKKLLLASTALVATAGVAAADVALSGSAEMGIKRQFGENTAEYHTDIGVTFKLSGESDNGISFGGSIDLEDTAGISNEFTDDGTDDYTVFVSAGGATLTIGDTDGALDKAVTDVAIGAALDDEHTSHAGFDGQGGIFAIDDEDADAGDSAGIGFDGAYDDQVARFDYAINDLTLSLSVEIADPGTVDFLDDLDLDANPIWAVGVAYDVELAGLDLGLGLGYQTLDGLGNAVAASVSTTFGGGFTAILNWGQQNFDGEIAEAAFAGDLDGETVTHVGVGLGYEMNALTIGVNWGQYTFEDEDDLDQSGYGLAVNYDLGGGLEAQFGYGHSTFDDGDDEEDAFSLGLAMSF